MGRHKSGHRSSEATARAPSEAQRIDASHFYLKHDQFCVWLKTAKDRRFESLDSDRAREYFDKFVRRYNLGALPEACYREVPLELREACMRSAHSWNLRVSQEERSELASALDEVDSATNGRRREGAPGPERAPASGPSAMGPPAGRAAPSAAAIAEDERERREKSRRYQMQKSRESREELLEEFGASERAGGRGALGVRQYVAGAREAGGDERDPLSGAGDDKWRAGALKRKEQQASRDSRIRELAARDRERTEACLQVLGVAELTAPIVIRPRDP